MTSCFFFQKPELDNISIRRQEQNNTMSQHQFIKTEGGEGVSNMPSLSPLGGADINLTASRCDSTSIIAIGKRKFQWTGY